MKKKMDESVTIAMFAVWFAFSALLMALGELTDCFTVSAIGGGMLGSVIFSSIFSLLKGGLNEKEIT